MAARRKKRGVPGGAPSEWLGGRLSPPFFIDSPDEAFRVEMALWMELPSGLVVGQEALQPGTEQGAVARTLGVAMERPLAGPPRRPDRIRVADAALAAEVRGAVGDMIPIVVAPTPELDQIIEQLVEAAPGGPRVASYLGRGRIAPTVVEDLFRAAQTLYRAAPWRFAGDDCVLRMDSTALGVEGACVSIIGALGEVRGVIIFPSLAGYQAFLRAADAPRPRGPGLDLGTGWLALSFDRKADVPPSIRREVAAHGWPVAGTKAYPIVERRDPDGASPPLVEQDLKVAAACAWSLATFTLKYADLLQAEQTGPISETYTDERGLDVRFTLPYEAFGSFEPAPAARRAGTEARQRLGRNDPCHCGSGRKYKKCHGPAERSQATTGNEGDASHDRDARWVNRLGDFALERFGSEWLRFGDAFSDVREAAQLAMPWSVYGYQVRGRTVLDHYLEEHGRGVRGPDREWLVAQQAAWLSVWEVIDVEPGSSLTLRDLLTHETRRVREVSGSRMLVARDTVLARIVDLEEVCLIGGTHHRPLPPSDGAEVVRRARGRLRLKRAVRPARLRNGEFGRYLIRRWEEAVAALDARQAMPPTLTNTDGDPLLVTIDHFEVASGKGPQVQSRIAALEHVAPPEAGADESEFVFLRPGRASDGDTVVGVARFSGAKLRLETNSPARADALRVRVEAACRGLVRHRAREHTDPLSSRQPRPASAPSEPPPPEMLEAMLEFKRQHYAAWIDESIPALGGQTPRAAVRTARGRAAVDVLLKDFENHEQRMPDVEAFDFTPIRRELGLD